MSDPVTNIDIEDVLSSIRRLVAQGDAGAADGAAAASRPASPAPDKLVLTPALRVDMPEDAAAKAHASADVQAAPQDAPGETDVASADPAPAAPATPEPPAADPPVDEGRRRLEQTIAELEAAVDGDGDGWDPDGSEATPVMDWNAAKSMECTLFAARAMTQTPPATEDDPADELAETGDPADSDARDGTTLIDEDMLRDLIAEVVRQELQGALGERITRNVRKLVRREIYRVLSSQDFQ